MGASKDKGIDDHDFLGAHGVLLMPVARPVLDRSTTRGRLSLSCTLFAQLANLPQC